MSTRHFRCEHALDLRGRSTRFPQGTRQDIEEYHRSVNICLERRGSWEVVARSAGLRCFACKDQWLWRYPRICYARPVASCYGSAAGQRGVGNIKRVGARSLRMVATKWRWRWHPLFNTLFRDFKQGRAPVPAFEQVFFSLPRPEVQISWDRPARQHPPGPADQKNGRMILGFVKYQVLRGQYIPWMEVGPRTDLVGIPENGATQADEQDDCSGTCILRL